MKTTEEAVLGRNYQQRASLGDFVPQILVFLGKPPQSRLWAAGYLRNETSRQDRISMGADSMSQRESFALAWLFLCSGFSAMRLRATIFLRALFRSTGEQRRHHGQQVDLVSSMEPPNVK